MNDLPSKEHRRIARLPNRELETLLVRGDTPDVGSLLDWEYFGANTVWTAPLLGILRFLKGFGRRPDSGEAFGWNTPVERGGLDEPWRAQPSEAAPKRFGWFSVGPVDATATDNKYLHAVLLDYGRGGNPRTDPSRLIRDYVVRVEPGSDDLLLGKAYFAVGPLRIPASYFVLERRRRLD